jgi:hypothetical protein
MSFLAPLYIAGLLAVSLPIIFHLIRRTPQGKQVFSSLMFLSPSPPRVTRRSRLTNIFLLILRGAALALLAFAFARPFLRQNQDLTVPQAKGKRVAILVDTSASMQRGDLWRQATQQVEQVLSDLAPTDEAALYFFDKDLRPGFTFKQWNELDASRRVAMFKGRLAEASPTYAGTSLGASLSSVADLLTENVNSTQAPDAVGREVVLISDMQQGGHVEALQGHQWPANVVLNVKPVALKDPTNASVQLVHESADTSEKTDERLRIRVSNQPESKKDQFTLAWSDEKGPIAGVDPVKVYVPAGRSQIARVAFPTSQPSRADRLVLSGDDCDFDNTLFIVPKSQDQVRVVYLGDDPENDPKALRFYLEVAAAPTPDRKVDLVARNTSEPLVDSDLTDARLIAISAAQSDDRIATIRKFIEQGGDVLWVLKDTPSAGGLSKLAQSPGLDISEAPPNNYSLLSRMDMDHPLFAPFADVRFSDFTKIHFWKHRAVKPEDEKVMRTIAWFDNGDPFLIEQSIGRGRLWVMTSGWQPADSQLALSTKFVPLIGGMLKRREGTTIESQHTVSEAIALPLPQGADPGTRYMKGPDGRQIELASNATTFAGADKPGIYHLIMKETDTPLAVNLAADEGKTAPVPVEELEQYGAKLGSKPISDEVIAKQRQLQIVELENKQKIWRWGILAVLGLLIAETALAGRIAHRQLQTEVTA